MVNIIVTVSDLPLGKSVFLNKTILKMHRSTVNCTSNYVSLITVGAFMLVSHYPELN